MEQKKQNPNELKQVILVNSWLEMPAGKLAAQVSHGSMAFLTDMLRKSHIVRHEETIETSVVFNSDVWDNWLVNGSFAKLTLLVRTEEELKQIIERATKYGLIEKEDYFPIIDHGRTVFNGVPTWTVTGFKPLPQKTINKLFGSLPLVK